MSAKEKEILKTLKDVLPEMTESQKSYLLGYGDAMAQMKKEGDKDAKDKA